MPFWRLYYHLVWATQDRSALITTALEPHLYAYLVSKSAKLESFVYAINGLNDHVHLLVAIPPKYAVADIVKNLKGSSSHFINHNFNLNYTFAWQRGYGAVSLGERQRTVAHAYITQQKQHHTENTTYAWLERDVEFDEGPPDRDVSSIDQVREEVESYSAEGFPF